jgi:hypothetical protein
MSTRSIGQLAAGLLLVSTVAMSASVLQPQGAAADESEFPAATMLSARIDGTTGYAVFRDNADGENDYIVYAFAGTDPQHYTVDSQVDVQRPGVPGSGRSVTVSVDGLQQGQSYCFMAQAEDEYTDINTAVGLYPTSEELASPPSNMICASPPVVSAPQAPTVNISANPHTTSPTCAACGVVPIDTTANPVSTSKTCLACGQTPAPSLPDFTIPSIIGNPQATQGLSSTYDVILANLGAKPSGQVQVQIQVTGSLRYLQMAQTPAGWICLGNSPIICTGPLGGYGDPPITTSVDFQLLVQANSAGLGSISAYANPNNTIQESNLTNNGDTLAVNVK